MKIKNRLWISFFIAIVMPLLVAIISVGVFSAVQLHRFQETYGVEEGDYSLLTKPYQAWNRMTDSYYKEMEQIAGETPDKLLTEEELNAWNEKLGKKHAALVLKKSDRVIYDGAAAYGWSAELPNSASYSNRSREGFLVGEDSQFLVKQLDFKDSSGSVYSLFIMTQVSGMLPEAKNILVGVVVGLVGLVLITGIGLTIWTSKGIMAPIKRLEVATRRISKGDLDFTIECGRNDEIGQLCEDFEQMRKRLKESAEEKINQDKQNKILISNICHDLKTPITSIQGYVEGIMDGVANTPEKQEKYIKTIYNKASEMNTLINELTIYSKLDTNRVPYNFQKLPVDEYFEDCIDELKLELETENVRLSYYNYCSDDVLIIADPEQLSRVIHNIVSNAVKYMNKPTRYINFRIKDVGDFIQVEIEDNGKGIAAKDLPFIFERFFRADSSRNETKGSGIGLSIVQKILDDHGGKIWATSKENVGTTMYFVLRKYQEVHNE